MVVDNLTSSNDHKRVININLFVLIIIFYICKEKNNNKEKEIFEFTQYFRLGVQARALGVR